MPNIPSAFANLFEIIDSDFVWNISSYKFILKLQNINWVIICEVSSSYVSEFSANWKTLCLVD